MSYGERLALPLDDIARLKARLPYRIELHMNQKTLDKLGKVCGATFFDPAFSGISSLAGIPIRIREYMDDNKVGVATFDANGKGVSYEVIEAFR